MEETTRAELLADPSIILDDKELMESLLTATDIKLGNNVVDLRHVAMSRLTHKFGELEGTHKSVVAAAYQNLLGTKQIHQAVIELMSMNNLDQFVLSLKSDLLKILNVDPISYLASVTRLFSVKACIVLGKLGSKSGSDTMAIISPFFTFITTDSADLALKESRPFINSSLTIF